MARVVGRAAKDAGQAGADVLGRVVELLGEEVGKKEKPIRRWEQQERVAADDLRAGRRAAAAKALFAQDVVERVGKTLER